MGTRARVNVFDRDKLIVSIYRQNDGYPDGLGLELSQFAGKMQIINGIGGQRMGEAANGMGCFAAQLIAHLKDHIGNVYIREADPESHGEEYSYNLRDKGGRVWMDARRGSMTMFGNPGDAEADMKPFFSGYASDFVVPKPDED